MIGQKLSRQNQLLLVWMCFPKQRWLHVFASSSDWFIGLSASVVIGLSNYFSFGFRNFSIKNRFIIIDFWARSD